VFGTDVIGVYRQSRLPGHHRTTIRSEWRLCDEGHLNLAYRWLCRLGLEGCLPSHSPFTENRHGRYPCTLGLVGGEGFAIDASVIEADASRNRKA
jgi:transposase